MKLYYSPSACSLSPHIVLRECGLKFELVKVDLKTKKTEVGQDFLNTNPKGYVPTLILDSGEVLTEGPVIVQYIADLAPGKKMVPVAGTMARYRLQEWLNFINGEIHKSLGAFFNPDLPEATKKSITERLVKRFDFVEKQLTKTPFLMGDNFNAADAYLFTVLRWTHYFKFDITPWPHLVKFLETVNARPAVQSALKAEELNKV